MNELKHLNKYFAKYKWKLGIGFFIVVAARILAILTPKFSGDMVELVEGYLKDGGDLSTLKAQPTDYPDAFAGLGAFICFFHIFDAADVHCSVPLYGGRSKKRGI